jgi:hypothetical protein
VWFLNVGEVMFGVQAADEATAERLVPLLPRALEPRLASPSPAG